MKRRRMAVTAISITAVLSLGSLFAVALPAAVAQAQTTGSWQYTGSLATGHADWWNTGFAQLPDGRVLAISGASGSGGLTPTAESYDPATGQWTSAGTLNDARYGFGPPSVLANGDVLVAGGHDVNVVDYATAELYDPTTNQWTLTGSLNQARRYPIQVELANGEVLVATGSFGLPTCTRYLSSAELYNPSTGQWTYTGSTLVPRESAMAIRLPDGDVLLAGGYNGGGGACTDTDPADTEIYDPSTGQWSYAGNLPHGWLGGAMVMLPDGKVLMVDGNQSGGSPFAEAVIFDPATNQWSEAATPTLPRTGAAATLLPDGNVLVSAGGQQQSEIYDPATNTWSLDATALDGTNNGGHTFLLPNGKVLLAGGSDSSDGSPSTTAELYTQPGGTYVALGDSYAAGVGSGGTSSGGACAQNTNAYPAVWSASHPAYKFTFAACSSATIGTVQSKVPDILAGTTLITVTAGGDPGFVPLILSCLVPTPKGNALCDAATLIAVAAINLVIEPELKNLYAAIKARAASVGDPTAQVIVLGYPDFFPESLLCGTSDYDEQVDINSAIDALDAAIAKAAAATAGTTVVDVRPAFAAHELCSQAPWLLGLMLNQNVLTSFHPNQAGQAQGYEASLAAITG